LNEEVFLKLDIQYLRFSSSYLAVLLYRISLFDGSSSTDNFEKSNWHRAMARPCCAPVFVIVAMIATISVLLGSVLSAKSSPLSEAKSHSTLHNPTRSADLPRESMLLPSHSDSQNRSKLELGKWEIAGAAAISILLLSAAYKAYRSRRSNALADDLLFDNPELEHPELSLIFLPKEAFSSLSAKREFVLIR
jgi:hypothetical protein